MSTSSPLLTNEFPSLDSFASDDSQPRRDSAASFHRSLDFPALSGGHALVSQPFVLSSPKPKFSFRALKMVIKWFLCLVLAESVTLIIFSLIALFSTAGSTTHRTEIIAIASTTGFLYFSIDSVLMESALQYFASLIAHALILLYVFYHYFTGNFGDFSLFESISLLVAIGILLFQLIYTFMTPAILRSFGWRVYKAIGSSSIELTRIYKIYLLFLSLLKFDGYLTLLLLLFSSLSNPIGNDLTNSGNSSKLIELLLNFIVLLISIAILILGLISIQSENYQLLYLFIILELIITPGFIIYRLSQLNQSLRITQQFLITAIIGLLIKISLIIISLRCGRQFNRGLKDRAFQRKNTHLLSSTDNEIRKSTLSESDRESTDNNHPSIDNDNDDGLLDDENVVNMESNPSSLVADIMS